MEARKGPSGPGRNDLGWAEHRRIDDSGWPGDVVDEAFGSSEFFDARDLVQVKYEMARR